MKNKCGDQDLKFDKGLESFCNQNGRTPVSPKIADIQFSCPTPRNYPGDPIISLGTNSQVELENSISLKLILTNIAYENLNALLGSRELRLMESSGEVLVAVSPKTYMRRRNSVDL